MKPLDPIRCQPDIDRAVRLHRSFFAVDNMQESVHTPSMDFDLILADVHRNAPDDPQARHDYYLARAFGVLDNVTQPTTRERVVRELLRQAIKATE